MNNRRIRIDIQQLVRRKAGQDGHVQLPPGVIELSETLEIRPGVRLCGGGTANAKHWPGTMFVPGPDFPADGRPAIYCRAPKGTGTDWWHHGGLSSFSVRGFPGPGIIAHSMGECSVLDDLAVIGCGENGVEVTGFSTPLHIGRLSLHGNGGAGLKLTGQNTTHIQILYLAGDNNVDGLLSFANGSPETCLRLMGWKSERWGDDPGHEDIFRIHNGNGGIYDLGCGRAHCTVDSTGAVVRQTAGVNNNVGNVLLLYTKAAGQATGYAYGYLNEKDGKSLTYAELDRQPFSMLPAAIGEPS